MPSHRKPRFRIGTVFKRTSKSATVRALKKSSMRMKKRLFTLVKKTKNSVKRMTRKVDRTVAKKIKSVTGRRRR